MEKMMIKKRINENRIHVYSSCRDFIWNFLESITKKPLRGKRKYKNIHRTDVLNRLHALTNEGNIYSPTKCILESKLNSSEKSTVLDTYKHVIKWLEFEHVSYDYISANEVEQKINHILKLMSFYVILSCLKDLSLLSCIKLLNTPWNPKVFIETWDEKLFQSVLKQVIDAKIRYFFLFDYLRDKLGSNGYPPLFNYLDNHLDKIECTFKNKNNVYYTKTLMDVIEELEIH